MDENGWELRKTYLMDRDGKIYEAVLNIANGRDRRILYDVENIRYIDKKEPLTAKLPSTVSGRGQRINRSSDGIVANGVKKVNTEQYSVNESYAEELRQWDRAGRPGGDMFILGSTGDVLQGLGAIESDIFIQADKVNTILEQHPEMTLDAIQRIPEILEDPVLVPQSQNAWGARQNTRLILFGSIKAQDGRPVMCALDLRPVENGLVLADMQKVTSAYTKNTNPVGFIRKSIVLYLDKKRTTPLLRTIGFSVPTELQRSGYIGSISHFDQNVNIQGVPFDQVVNEKAAPETFGEEVQRQLLGPEEFERQRTQRFSYGGESSASADLDARARRKMTAEERRQTPPARGSDDMVFAEGGASAQDYIPGDVSKDVFIEKEATPFLTGAQNVGLPGGATSTLNIINKIFSVKQKERNKIRYSVEDENSGKGDDYAALESELKAEQRIREDMFLEDRLGAEGRQQYRAYQKSEKETARKKARERGAAKAQEKNAQPVAQSEAYLAKRNLRKEILNLFSIPDGQRQKLGRAIDAYADRLLKNRQLTEADRKAFFDRMYESGVMRIPADEYSAMGRAHIHGGRIYVPDSVVNDFGGDWNEFRNTIIFAFGKNANESLPAHHFCQRQKCKRVPVALSAQPCYNAINDTLGGGSLASYFSASR